MTGSDVALIITAGGTLVTAIGVVLVNLKTSQVHTLVNSQHDALAEYQVTLINALQAAGIKIPTTNTTSVAPTEPPAQKTLMKGK